MPSFTPLWIGCDPANFRAGRPAPYQPMAIVLHVSGGPLSSADARFRDAASQVSAHYIVGKTGELHQYVHETDTAFHAGIVIAPTWTLLKPNVNPNFYTLGIGHEGLPGDVVTPAQLAGSVALVSDLAQRWSIPLDLDHVIAHDQIRASAQCPGASILPQLWLDTIAGEEAHEPPGALLLQTTAAVNVRAAATASAPILRTIPTGSRISATGDIAGQAVQGNSSWYGIRGGGFIWSGATRLLTPAS